MSGVIGQVKDSLDGLKRDVEGLSNMWKLVLVIVVIIVLGWFLSKRGWNVPYFSDARPPKPTPVPVSAPAVPVAAVAPAATSA